MTKKKKEKKHCCPLVVRYCNADTKTHLWHFCTQFFTADELKSLNRFHLYNMVCKKYQIYGNYCKSTLFLINVWAHAIMLKKGEKEKDEKYPDEVIVSVAALDLIYYHSESFDHLLPG